MSHVSELKYLVERFTRLLAIMEDQVLTHKELSNLSIRQLNYLDLIRSFETPKVSDLSEHLRVSKPTIAIALKSLMDKGYVKKMQSADDKRIFNIELTKKGRKINSIHDQAHEKIVREIFKCLTEKEVEIFEKLVSKILTNSELDL
jgi:DNA-binding MarR family transcriptional regulator